MKYWTLFDDNQLLVSAIQFYGCNATGAFQDFVNILSAKYREIWYKS